MTKLAISVPFHAGESFTSFCSRVAMANGAASSRSFAMHMGIPFRTIALAEPSGLARIAAMTGERVELLTSGLATRVGNVFSINGEVVTSTYFNRTRFRYCPACLAEDVSTGTGPAASRPFGRLAWQVSFIRTCHRHGTLLATSKRDVRFNLRDDFSAIWRGLPADEKIVARPRMAITDFERYILRRLGGAKDITGWADSMPLYVVGHLSETVGAAKLFGKWFTSGRLNNADWHAAGDTGFEILANEKRFAGFLDFQQDEFLQKKRNHYLGQALYGTLFRRLDEGLREDRNFDTVRRFIREHAIRTLPFGPEDVLFGRLGLSRRLHSIKTASDQSGLGIKFLCSHLVNTGIIAKEDLNTTPHRVFIDAIRVDEMLETLACREADDTQKSTVEEKEAGAMLGVSPELWRDIAMTFGLRDKPYSRVSRLQVRTFLQDLENAAVGNTTQTDGLLEPIRAAMACTCRVTEILQLVLAGDLKTVVIDGLRHGIAKILVDRDEVLSSFRGDRFRQHLMSTEVAERLRIDMDSLTRLARSGILPRARLSGAAGQFCYLETDVRTFNKTYASTSRIASVAKLSVSAVAAAFREKAIEPAIGKDVRSAHFYLISQIVDVLPPGIIEQLYRDDNLALSIA